MVITSLPIKAAELEKIKNNNINTRINKINILINKILTRI